MTSGDHLEVEHRGLVGGVRGWPVDRPNRAPAVRLTLSQKRLFPRGAMLLIFASANARQLFKDARA